MTASIVEIGEDVRRAALIDGCLTIAFDGGEVSRIPLGRVAGVVDGGHGLTWSGSLLAALSERGAGIVLCGPNHRSRTLSWPVPEHSSWPRLIAIQMAANRLFARQLWRILEAAQIRQRRSVLDVLGRMPPHSKLPPRYTSRRAKPESLEDQLRRRYWGWLTGPGFHRDPRRSGANEVVNYGYTALRIAATTAVQAAGLHPSISLRGRGETKSLVDDLMAPFTPTLDLAAVAMLESGAEAVTPRVRTRFAMLFGAPLDSSGGPVELGQALARLASSLARSYETGEPRLDLALPLHNSESLARSLA